MDYRLEDLIDIPLLQSLQEKLNLVYSFPSAIVNNDGKVLTAVAWQDICTKFHRTNPECEKECIKSDQYILDHLHEANPAVSYQCPHGLVDNATPIIIDGKHLGNFFTGQFFLEKQDLKFFKKQAIKYGFDEKTYMEAVEKVPVWTKEKLVLYLDFIKGFIEMIAGLGLKNLKEIETRKIVREQEERLRFYTDNSPLAVVEWDSDFIVTKWTGESENIFGWKSEEVDGKKIIDLNIIYEPDIPIVQKTMEKLTNGLFKQVVSSNRNYRKDRSIITCEWYNTILKNQNGEMLTVLSQVLDITERKKIEDKLLFINKAVESTSDSIGISDAQGHHFYQNKASTNMFEYATAEEMEAAGGGAITVKDPEVAKEMYDNIVSGKSWSGELEMVKKSGRVFHAYERADAIKDSEGNIIGLIGIVTDITERKKAEGNLRESENKYRNLFNNSEVGMFRTRLDGSEILEFNEKYLKILGYTHDEIKGKPSNDIWANKQERDNMVKRLKTEGQVTDLECDLLTKQGNVINCITSLRVFPNGILEGSIQDITNRKQAEEEIKNMKESLEQLNFRLEEIREDERSLIAGEIHDRLGQALTALKIDTNWLIGKTTIDSNESKKLNGMSELLTGISTDVQRISAELRPPMLDDVGIVAALEWYIDEFEKRTSVKCHLKLDDIKFPDKKKGLVLYRILQESLTNVVRHANAKNVNINLYQADDSVIMEVIDDGIGIKKEKINSYKSLGLIGMRERIKKFKGNMDISSALNKGTKLTVSIPLN